MALQPGQALPENELTPEQHQELRVESAKGMMENPRLNEAEQKAWEKEYNKQLKKQVEMTQNKFQKMVNATLDIQNEVQAGGNPFEGLIGGNNG